MFAPEDYQLLDFGQGRKLERFGAVVLDRPAPAATGPVQDSERWATAAARYERTTADRGVWRSVVAASQLPSRWNIRHGGTLLELKLTPFGHLGVFPEQAGNWDWTAERVAAAGGGIRVLNLFAYTGASTLAAAGAGAEVVHVDAARNIVAWARRNAELSGLGGAPVRWICDDAVTFVRRELKRGNAYRAVILDPPSYGHGAKGEIWKLAEHLPSLLADCARLTASDRSFVLLSCHTPGFGPETLAAMLADAFDGENIESAEMRLTTPSVRALVSGAMARSR
jgi:23S rRNA (cytosine1962-C5)-methyltransferase